MGQNIFCEGGDNFFFFTVFSPLRNQASISQLGQLQEVHCVTRVSNRLVCAYEFAHQYYILARLPASP